MKSSSGKPGYITTSQLRRILVRIISLVAGLAILLHMLKFFSPLSSIPALYLMPFLPVLVIGLPYWLASGRYRRSIAIWMVISVPLVGLLWSDHFTEAILIIVSITTMVAFGAIIADRLDWDLAARHFTVGFILAAIVLIYDLAFPIYPKLNSASRLGSVFDATGTRIIEPNQAGTHASFAILVALSILNTTQGKKQQRVDRMLAYIGISLAISVIVLSQSRGSLAAILVAIGIALLLGRAVVSLRNWITISLGFVMGGIALVLTNASILERFSASDVTSGNGRTGIWQSAIDMATSDPLTFLFGAGTADGPFALDRYDQSLVATLGGSRTAAGPIDLVEINAHNSLIEWLINYGAVGVFIALMALAVVAVRARFIDRGQYFATGQAMVSLFIMISLTLVAYRMVGVSIACGGMTLGYLYCHRPTDQNIVTFRHDASASPS